MKMKIRMLKEKNLLLKKSKLSYQVFKAEIKKEFLQKKMNKAIAAYNKQSDKLWAISEQLAGTNGLLSLCKDGKVEVVG